MWARLGSNQRPPACKAAEAHRCAIGPVERLDEDRTRHSYVVAKRSLAWVFHMNVRDTWGKSTEVPVLRGNMSLPRVR